MRWFSYWMSGSSNSESGMQCCTHTRVCNFIEWMPTTVCPEATVKGSAVSTYLYTDGSVCSVYNGVLQCQVVN